MSSSIYEEALADVKKLKEVAEQNAKNAIIDAVTPKIREMIEKQLIGDHSEDDGDVLSDLAESLLDTDADDVQLTSESLKALSGLVNSGVGFSAKDAELSSLLVQERLLIIMDEAADTAPDLDALAEMKREIVRTHSQLVENRSTTDSVDFERIQKRLASLDHFLNEAIGDKEMSERDLRSILDEDALRLVLDLGDEVEVGAGAVVDPANIELSLETSDETEEVEAAPEGEEVEAEEVEDVDVLSQEATAGAPFAADVGDHLGESVSDEDEILEINEDELASMIRSILSEDDASDELSAMGADEDQDVDEDVLVMDDTADEMGGGHGLDESSDEGLSDDTVVEISESMLRDELHRMRQLNEGTTIQVPAPVSTNIVSNEKHDVGPNEADQLKTQLREYKKAVSSLRNQLDESNLFNAKLLYANKLLQNRDLSDRQRVNIVESLDNAKSLREVRLLYKSLADSNKTTSKLTESKRRRAAGSASRPTRPGSVSKESYPETDRWALLAGLNK